MEIRSFLSWSGWPDLNRRLFVPNRANVRTTDLMRVIGAGQSAEHSQVDRIWPPTRAARRSRFAPRMGHHRERSAGPARPAAGEAPSTLSNFARLGPAKVGKVRDLDHRLAWWALNGSGRSRMRLAMRLERDRPRCPGHRDRAAGPGSGEFHVISTRSAAGLHGTGFWWRLMTRAGVRRTLPAMVRKPQGGWPPWLT